MRAVLPLCVEHGTRLITNMGVANPEGAAGQDRARSRATSASAGSGSRRSRATTSAP